MGEYPDTIHFTGTNKPVRVEYEVLNLPIEGEIPKEINGAFFRAVPDPAHPPMYEDEIALSGDGMVSRFRIQDGRVDHAIRYVETERFLLEKKARKSLFGKYRNPFTSDPSVRDVSMTVANTTPVWHAGRLLMTKEDGHPYEINPHTLETIGKFDFDGQLKSETFTAHPRIDPETGEMFFFGYEADGLAGRMISYGIADKDGNLVSEQFFEAPYCASVHDFAITENYAIFPLFPTTAELDRLKDGGAHWAHQQDLESWVAIMPRYGKTDEIRWFKGPKGVSSFHLVNAFEKDGKIHLDHHMTDTNAFAFMREAGGVFRNQMEIDGGLTRWSFDMSKNDDSFEEIRIAPPGDMPRLRDKDQGRPYDKLWYLSMNPEGGPPVPGGPVGMSFNCMLEFHPGTGRIGMMPLEPGLAINEAVHVPSNKAGKEGWLLTVIDRMQDDGRITGELWIIDADNIAAGPVAKAFLPVETRAQVHGWWVSGEKLDNAKASA